MLQALFANVLYSLWTSTYHNFLKVNDAIRKFFGRPRQMIVKFNEIGHEGVCFKFPY